MSNIQVTFEGMMIHVENYNYVIAVDRPYNRKTHFEATGERNDPDARCLIPTMSKSELT